MYRIQLLVLTFITFTISNGQETTVKLKGRVLSSSNDVTSVHVTNQMTNKGTITDANGSFVITVKLLDTLVFSAVQFKKEKVIVSQEIIDMPVFLVSLEDMLTELSEVVVKPYNLSGHLNKDVDGLTISRVISASTENLPNAHLKPITQSERQLYNARSWDSKFNIVTIDPIFNYFSGRTKMLNERIKRDANAKLFGAVRRFYEDSLYTNRLKIPKKEIDAFMYFCEVDVGFQTIVDTHDHLKIWEYMRKKSIIYRKNNELD